MERGEGVIVGRGGGVIVERGRGVVSEGEEWVIVFEGFLGKDYC